MKNLLPFEKVKREIIVKKEFTTSNEYGVDPSERKISELINYGVICLNKPSGPTSHQVADYVKGILNVKAGHGGTLDPGVIGVLPIALGDATRVLHALLKAGKEYICLMYLHKDVKPEIVEKALLDSIGKIKQLPPIKSAVKRQLRQREIYYVEVLEINGRNALFKIGTEAGFYVRKFCYDFGKKLGTNAHMQELVRVKAGPFKDKEWYTLHDIKDGYEYYKQGNEDYLRKIIKPVEFAISHLSKIWIIDTAVDSICHGASLSIPGIAKFNSDVKENTLVAVMTLKDELVCLGKAAMNSEDIKKQEKGIVVTSTKVFMKPEVYPKYKKE